MAPPAWNAGLQTGTRGAPRRARRNAARPKWRAHLRAPTRGMALSFAPPGSDRTRRSRRPARPNSETPPAALRAACRSEDRRSQPIPHNPTPILGVVSPSKAFSIRRTARINTAEVSLDERPAIYMNWLGGILPGQSRPPRSRGCPDLLSGPAGGSPDKIPSATVRHGCLAGSSCADLARAEPPIALRSPPVSHWPIPPTAKLQRTCAYRPASRTNTFVADSPGIPGSTREQSCASLKPLDRRCVAAMLDNV